MKLASLLKNPKDVRLEKSRASLDEVNYSGCQIKGSARAHLPLVERNMTFGIHKGKYVREVPYDYFEWIIKKSKLSKSMKEWATKCIAAKKRKEKSY